MQTEVRGDDTDQRHPGDVVALRDHLRADQHVELAAVEAGQDRALRALARRGVAVEPADPRGGVRRDQLLVEPLGAEALHAALGAAALRARLERVLAVAAVVAAQLALERIAHAARPVAVRVIDERHVAVFAAECEAAREAVDPAREAAPVQEQDRLAAGRERLGKRLAQRAREHAAAPAARALVGGRRSRPSAAAGSPRAGQDQRSISPCAQRHAVRRRGRRAEQERAARALGAHARDLAGVVAEALLALVRGLVLLVDRDQTQIGVGREDGRARADRDGHAALADRPPLVEALAARESAVQHRDPLAEARAEAVDELVGERDLGHEHDGALPAREGGLGSALVDLGLAAAGDPVQQELGEAAGLDRRRDLGQRGALMRRELRRRARRDQRIDVLAAHHLALLAQDEPRRDQRAQRRGRARRCGRRAERLQQLELARRAREILARSFEVQPRRAPVHALGARAHARRVGARLRDTIPSRSSRAARTAAGKRVSGRTRARALAERPQHAGERAAQPRARARACRRAGASPASRLGRCRAARAAAGHTGGHSASRAARSTTSSSSSGSTGSSSSTCCTRRSGPRLRACASDLFAITIPTTRRPPAGTITRAPGSARSPSASA